MEIKFIKDYRQYNKGDIVNPGQAVAQVYIERGIACKLATKPKDPKARKR